MLLLLVRDPRLTALPCPAVLQLEIGWDDNQATKEYVQDVVSSIAEQLDVRQLYGRHQLRDDSASQFALSAMVCYYGQHYVIFVQKKDNWVFMDDGKAIQIGSWDAAVERCITGRYQPSVLLYTTIDGPASP